jgi:hypothetical protein
MKKIIILFALLINTTAYSATIKIISFLAIEIANDRINHPLAELCGKVENAESIPTFIQVKVDEGARRPAVYNTLADDKGFFCLTLVTYRGTAAVSIIGKQTSYKAQLKN